MTMNSRLNFGVLIEVLFYEITEKTQRANERVVNSVQRDAILRKLR